jgi:hypothetical protein
MFGGRATAYYWDRKLQKSRKKYYRISTQFLVIRVNRAPMLGFAGQKAAIA